MNVRYEIKINVHALYKFHKIRIIIVNKTNRNKIEK